MKIYEIMNKQQAKIDLMIGILTNENSTILSTGLLGIRSVNAKGYAMWLRLRYQRKGKKRIQRFPSTYLRDLTKHLNNHNPHLIYS